MAPLVFITGASSGLGQSLAARFYAAGYRLALVARRADAIEQWAHTAQLDPQRYRVYCADVADLEGMATLGAQCIANQGLPDVVIANAGISIGMDTSVRNDLDVFDQVMSTNVIGMAATFHPFIEAMKSRDITSMRNGQVGTLVGIASVAGIRGLPGHAAYCASKAAAISYCESLRGELNPLGFKVVTLAPGYIKTPLTQKNKFPMPFLMTADAFADQALKAIERGTSFQVIPWQMAWVTRLLRILPDALLDRAFKNQPRKHRAP